MPHVVDLADGFQVSDDPSRLDLDMIHRFLSEDSYWARGRARALVERSIAHSLCLGVYAPEGRQVGFAMVVTDRTMMAHLANVFILPPWRGRGLGDALVRAALEHPELATIRRWTLNTDDAQGLYARYGFRPAVPAASAMEWQRRPATSG